MTFFLQLPTPFCRYILLNLPLRGGSAKFGVVFDFRLGATCADGRIQAVLKVESNHLRRARTWK